MRSDFQVVTHWIFMYLVKYCPIPTKQQKKEQTILKTRINLVNYGLSPNETAVSINDVDLFSNGESNNV